MYSERDFEPELDSAPAITGDVPNRTSNSDLEPSQQSAKKLSTAGARSPSVTSQQRSKDDIYDFSNTQY